MSAAEENAALEAELLELQREVTRLCDVMAAAREYIAMRDVRAADAVLAAALEGDLSV